jgi:putative transposase
MVWIPKYRKTVLVDEVAERTISLIYEVSRKNRYKVLALEVMPDHVHLFCSVRPNHAPSTIVKIFKGSLARTLFKEFPGLKKKFWKGHLWAPSYYVGTAGHVSAETIKRYIEECQRL